MRVELRSTQKIVTLNGVPARVWEGRTERGVEVHAFIALIACKGDADTFELDLELVEHRPPSPDVDSLPGGLAL